MSQLFKTLAKQNNQVGEVRLVKSFLITVVGLGNAQVRARVLFDNGAIGMVRSFSGDETIVYLLSSDDDTITVGQQAVIQSDDMTIHPSTKLKGRVVDPLLRPLDDGPEIVAKSSQQIFGEAPRFDQRLLLDQQLETGVTIIDTLFPIVMGQRIALMGDPKSGKTTFAAQLAIHQAKFGRTVVFVLIAKRRTDVERLIGILTRAGTMDKVVLVVADSFAALPMAYLAPYSGCSVAEYFWQHGEDVVIIYDDLTNHAKIYREMSLLEGASPGRESYPGDMFYRHSSLLERAGRLASNQRTLTALPIITIANNDITSFLSTSIISITDGQLVFDTEEMQRGAAPPINTGISVSRVGGRAQQMLQKQMAQDIFKALADYRQASQFSHFGQELPEHYREALRLGERLQQMFNQEPNEFFSLAEQQIILKTAFLAGESSLDIPEIKRRVRATMDAALATQTHEDMANELIKMQRGKK